MAKFQISNSLPDRQAGEAQINPVTDKMKNNYVSNGVNSKSQCSKFQTKAFRSLVTWSLVIVCNLVLACLPAGRVPWLSYLSAQEWQEKSGEHFIVYFTNDQDSDFAKGLLDKAETYYRNIALDLGYPRYSDFWLWDKRVKIYVYPDHSSFVKATGQPEWSQGMADYKVKKIISYVWSQGFLESLLPHEMAHLIFRDFVGFKGEVPLWLDEGVAQWEEELRRQEMKQLVYKLYDEDSLLSLNDMLHLDIREIRDKDRIYIRPTRTKNEEPGVLFISGNNLVRTFYIQSFGLVGFLIEKYNSESFANFCRQLRDGKSLEEALRFAYPTYIRSIAELEDRWRGYLKEEYS